MTRDIDLLKVEASVLEEDFQHLIAQATGKTSVAWGPFYELAHACNSHVTLIADRLTSLQEAVALLRSCDLAAASQQSRQLEALIGDVVNRCKCASFSSHARMGRNARVSFVQMQQRAAAKEQDIMQQASKLRAYCQKLENLKATGLSTYQQTWQLRRHGRAHQAVLLAEDLDMQFCTLITAAVHDRHRLVGLVEELLAERTLSPLQLQQHMDDIRCCKFLSDTAQEESVALRPASPFAGLVPVRARPCGSSLGMPSLVTPPAIRPASQLTSTPTPPRRNLFALSITPKPAGTSSQPVAKPPARTSLFTMPPVRPASRAAAGNPTNPPPRFLPELRLRQQANAARSTVVRGNSSKPPADLPSMPQLVAVSGSSHQPELAPACGQQHASQPTRRLFDLPTAPERALNLVNRAAVPRSPFATEAMQHAAAAKPAASAAPPNTPMHAPAEVPAAHATAAELPAHEALLMEELRRVMPTVVNPRQHLPALLRRLADDIEARGDAALAADPPLPLPTPAASIQPVSRTSASPAIAQKAESSAAVAAAVPAAEQVKLVTGQRSSSQAGLRAAIQSLQRVQETVGRKVAVEGGQFQELQGKVARMDQRLQALETRRDRAPSAFKPPAVKPLAMQQRSSAMQTGPDSGSASAVKPTRATQTSHPLPAFGPYRVILSPPSLTRACTGSQTMQVSAASTTQASQTLGVPPGSISSTTQTSLIEQSSWATQLPVSREQGVMTQAVATSHADVGTEKLCLDIKRIVEQASCMHLDQPNSAPAKSSSMTGGAGNLSVQQWLSVDESLMPISKAPTSGPSSVTDEEHPYHPLPSSAQPAAASFMSAATSAPSSVPWDTNGIYQLMHSQLSAPGVDSDDDSHALLPPKNTPVGNSPFATPTSSLFWGASNPVTSAEIASLLQPMELDAAAWPSFGSPEICMPWRSSSNGNAQAQMHMPDLLSSSFAGSLPSLPPLRITPSAAPSSVHVPISPCADHASSLGQQEASSEDAVCKFLSREHPPRGSVSDKASSEAPTDFTVLTSASLGGDKQTGVVQEAASGGSSPSSGNAAAYMACANGSSILQESFDLAKSAQSAASQGRTASLAGSQLQDCYIAGHPCTSPVDPPNSPAAEPALLQSISEDDITSDTDELALFQQRLAAQISASSASAAMPGPVPDFTQLPLFGRGVNIGVSPLDVPPASPESDLEGSDDSEGWEELEAGEAEGSTA